MRGNFKFRKIFIFILFGLLLSGCSLFNKEPIDDIEVKLEIIGPKTIEIGQTIHLTVEFSQEDSINEVSRSSEDPSILTIDEFGEVKALKKGETNIIVKSIHYNVTVKHKITVEEKKVLSDEEKVENILKSMTLNEKIGQMFVIGFWTDPNSNNLTLPSHAIEDIKTFKYGNFILFDYNTKTPQGLVNLTTSLQKQVIATTNIPGFISIDQEGGLVVKAYNGPTFFPGNMAVAATNDPNNSYLIGKAVGSELRDFGINMNFAPALDVNNNPDNPIIGVRSYSDDPETVTKFGVNMFKGLQESKVIASAKHFPGHGDTSIDTHFGLPEIPHSLERLHEVELYPLKKAINQGIEAIMTTHIIFSAIDKEYPATLSKKVLTGLLREELGFKGLIITDGMSMDAISKNFGMKQAGELAVKAGVDLLTFTGNRAHQNDAYNGILEAVNKKEISEERINESVRRILLRKLRYGILDNPYPLKDAATKDYSLNQELAKTISKNSITLAKGNFTGLDKSKKTLVISPATTRYPLLPNLTGNQNSFAYLLSTNLISQGFNSSYEIITANINDTSINSLVNKARDYDQVIIATENANLNQANLVNQLLEIHPDLIAIALRNPYDINRYSSVQTYIAIYEYSPVSMKSIISYLNQEFEATGNLPVKLN